ncbi:MAG: hypothetical protein PVJ80_11155 [Gemmatimonadota bacterium]|jgi:hypothetical protein
MAVLRSLRQPGLGDRLPSLPAIEALPLAPREPGLKPLPISTDAPRTLGLRRIHVLNHGVSTFLRDWEIWVKVPWSDALTEGRVLSRTEWRTLTDGVAAKGQIPVLCREDSLRAPRHRPVKRDLPFLIEGLLPDDVSVEGLTVYVLFADRTHRVWHYG